MASKTFDKYVIKELKSLRDRLKFRYVMENLSKDTLLELAYIITEIDELLSEYTVVRRKQSGKKGV